MIKVFRKIRQNLLMENKTGKYFKYAIGEIVLVVIGILIAIQINNWNEDRKSFAQGRVLMKELIEEFQLHIDAYNYGLDRQIESFESQKKLFKIKDLDSVDSDSLFDILGFANIDINITSNTYEKIKNQGISSLSKNDSLNKAIAYHFMESIDLYNRRINWYLDRTKSRLKYLDESNLQFNNDIIECFPKVNDDVIKADRLNFIYMPRTKALISNSYSDKLSAIEFLIRSKKNKIKLIQAIHKELSLTQSDLEPLPSFDEFLNYKISE